MPFLQFKGKTAVETYHYSLPHHTLEFDTSLSVLNTGQEPTLDDNLIIEGDNLLALKALLPTHTGCIKCIYIDPPYNTGEEGWVYNDNLNQPQFKEWIGETVGKEGEDTCRHDKWCCMMLPRLQLLKMLLHDDGIIFVSIDFNEVHHLRLLMNEVFGEDSFLSDFVWESRLNKDNRNVTGVSADHEYVVCYGKKVRGAARDKSQYSNPDNDTRGPWTSGNMVGLASQEQRPNLHHDITDPETGIVYLRPTMGWRYDTNTMKRLIGEKRILWPTEPTGRPRRKVFLDELSDEFTGFSSIIGADVYTRDGTKALETIFGKRVLEFPKPSELIKELLEQGTEPDAIVLDSFAGSGTTAQAVLELNQTDGGNRKFILVQQKYDTKENEKTKFNICETITRERVRRVVQGYRYTGTQTETLLEEKVGLNTLKKADELLKRIEAAREEGRANYDDVRAEMKDGLVRVEGIRKIKEKTEGLGGTFAYARISEHPLFGEYRDMGEHQPSWENLAAYIFYTETSRQFDRNAATAETGKIGEHAKNSYYLLYTPDDEQGKGLGIGFLKTVAAHDANKNLVVYSEKFVMHRDTLHKWEEENHKKVRSMLVPFNLR